MNRKDDIDRVLFEHDMEKFVELYEQKVNLIGHDFNPILAERAKRRKQRRVLLIVIAIFAGAFAGWLLTNLWR